MAYDRHNTSDLGADFRRKERQLIPGKQIAAEAKTDHDEQQKDAAQPGNFAWWIISSEEKYAEHVNEQRRDH